MDKDKDKFTSQFIYLFNKYLFSLEVVPSTAQGLEASVVNKIQFLPSGKMCCCRKLRHKNNTLRR